MKFKADYCFVLAWGDRRFYCTKLILYSGWLSRYVYQNMKTAFFIKKCIFEYVLIIFLYIVKYPKSILESYRSLIATILSRCADRAMPSLITVGLSCLHTFEYADLMLTALIIWFLKRHVNVLTPINLKQIHMDLGNTETHVFPLHPSFTLLTP